MNTQSSTETEIKTLLADLWKNHLPTTRERLDVLELAARSAKDGGILETQREEAQSVAHKLAGNLGMFGHKHAGEVASEIEEILKQPTSEELRQLPELTRQLREMLAPYLTSAA
ncbi:MAG: Hpt domain-containing protein [Edaphobacter sp.]|uniref:Hpt domain-containing protein n=1 Tax=Edaphobacter sp. TaxID=1934404 RepID=UPI00239825A8|nr:Hpt domain-containing protein [Edaphobacter sp.]MDE1175504.1 Hpt domain-containing protein [Edaphobacter sp.]